VAKGTLAMARSDRMTTSSACSQLHPDIKKVLKHHPELAKQYLTACQTFNALFETRFMKSDEAF
jgi:hypothetical protein